MKYAVHPDPAFGLTAAELARLYELHAWEWVEWDDDDPQTFHGRRWGDYLHVYSSMDGRYGRPELP